MGGGRYLHTPVALSPGNTLVPIQCLGLIGPQSRSGCFGEQMNFWSLSGFESRTVQPVASRWTDRANQALRVMAVKHSSRTEMGNSRDGRDCLRAQDGE